jgi:dihydroorotase
MKTLIQNGRVIDPASGFDEVADIAIAAGKIQAIVKKGEALPRGFQAEKT